MTKKLLYIVKGVHSAKETPSSEKEKALSCQRVQGELITEIARRTGCTAYFADGMTEEGAKFSNSILEQLVNSEEERKKLFEELATNIEKLGYGEEELDYFRKFMGLWQEGIRIKHYKTEDEFDELELLSEEFLRGNVSEENYSLACTYVAQGGDPFYLNVSANLEHVFLKHRDKNIFENICMQARDINILFIGNSHPLRDFSTQKHEFKIYQIDITHNGSITLKGNLQASFKGFIDNLTNAYRLNNNMSYES